ncbi:MAG: hypothetical protein Q8Q92_00985 [bacterium]|nr:hypothetical protein [bacterium]
MEIESKQQILERRKEIEQELTDTLKETKSDFSLDHVRDAIYNEGDNDDMMKVIAMFDRGGDASELSNLLELVTDAWNYFPHKVLGGISPAEKMSKYKNEDSKTKRKAHVKYEKLSKKQIDLLWSGGGRGPYSQANLIRQIRILNDSGSRVLLVGEVEINPTTFEFVNKNRHCDEFKKDIMIQQLLDGAEYRGPEFGYIVSAFEKEYASDEVLAQAESSLKYAQECIIRMHKFVIDNLR